MKRIACILAALMLLAVFPAQADTWYVYTANGKTLNLRSPKDNSVIGNIPYGTRLETDDDLSTETAAYVTYGGKSGYVKWEFLVKDPPPARNSGSSVPSASGAAPTNLRPADGAGAITIQAFGAYIEYAAGATGKYSAVSYDTPREIKITADLNGKRPAYWVIDGVRYDFEPTVPKTLTIDNAWDNMIVEAVTASSGSYTLLSPADIQAMRTGETLVARTINAKLCHLTAKDNGKGGWMDAFDFTYDYLNLATNKWEAGGQLTTRVRATVPKNKKIVYWKFDETHMKFSTDVTQFIVRTLNVSKTYEPIFNGSSAARVSPAPTSSLPNGGTPLFTSRPGESYTYSTATPAPVTRPSTGTATNTRPSTATATVAPTATPAPVTRPSTNTRPSTGTGTNTRPSTGTGTIARPSTATATPAPATRPSTGTETNARPSTAATVYTVSCTGCTFSGGGYDRASSGTVAAGTTITVYARARGISSWIVNGARRAIDRNGTLDTSTPITVTVNRNTTITCNYD